MARPGWTAEIEVDADLSKVPDGPLEAAKYALDQVRQLAEPFVVVHRHNADDTTDNWMVDTSDGTVTFIGSSRSGPTPEERIMGDGDPDRTRDLGGEEI